MKTPKRIDLDPEKMNEFLQRVKNRKLTNEDYDIIEGMADTITFLSRAVQHKRASIGRLVRMLFGPPTEKIKKILGKDKSDRQIYRKLTFAGNGLSNGAFALQSLRRDL